jgi:hypothetical protein
MLPARRTTSQIRTRVLRRTGPESLDARPNPSIINYKVQRPIDNYNSEVFVNNYHSEIFVVDNYNSEDFVHNYNSEVFGESHEVGCGLSPYPRVRKRTRLRGDYIFFSLPNVIFGSYTLVCWHISPASSKAILQALVPTPGPRP